MFFAFFLFHLINSLKNQTTKTNSIRKTLLNFILSEKTSSATSKDLTKKIQIVSPILYGSSCSHKVRITQKDSNKKINHFFPSIKSARVPSIQHTSNKLSADKNLQNYKTSLIIRENDFYSSKFYKKAHGIFGRENSAKMFKSFKFLNEYASSLRPHNNKKLEEELYSKTRNPFKSFNSDGSNTRDNTPSYSENSSCNWAPKISLKT